MKKISFERATYKGRQIEDSKYLGPGYMGSGSFESHCEQLSDPTSWVHSSTNRWIRAYVVDVNKERIDKIYSDAVHEIEKTSNYEVEARYTKDSTGDD
jgi:hypothetical protein